jgi:protein-L-isoaspartate(D-aspartate) O-methyltransferase
MNEADLNIVRREYAKQVVATALGVADPRLEAALAAVRREDFLGPGPWMTFRLPDQYVETPDADPVHLYQDALFGLVPEKGLNNGLPSFVTMLISFGRPAEGDHAVHVGAGVGYYTAVISHLVGARGRVTAIEYEPDLAARAVRNFESSPNVRVIQGDGSKSPLEAADVIYVNAGASQLAEVWLDALKDGGRLVLPLTASFAMPSGVTMTAGAIFLIERRDREYLAEWKAPTAIYPCIGARDAISDAALAEGFKKGGERNVKRLYRTGDIPEERCWVRTPSWSLAYA